MLVCQGGEILAHVLQGRGEGIPGKLDWELEDRVAQG